MGRLLGLVRFLKLISLKNFKSLLLLLILLTLLENYYASLTLLLFYL
jgi:hypothetical protein